MSNTSTAPPSNAAVMTLPPPNTHSRFGVTNENSRTASAVGAARNVMFAPSGTGRLLFPSKHHRWPVSPYPAPLKRLLISGAPHGQRANLLDPSIEVKICKRVFFEIINRTIRPGDIAIECHSHTSHNIFIIQSRLHHLILHSECPTSVEKRLLATANISD